jgi:protein-export membrane protein SecD/preprotein translocase SecF subunit
MSVVSEPRRTVAAMSARTRVLLIIAVVALSLWSLYPPGETIKLGLDLNGGVQLVLRVDTDDGLRAETVATAERLRETLKGGGQSAVTIEVTSPTEFVVAGILDAAALQNAAAPFDAGFERIAKSGGILFRMRTATTRQVREETMQQALETIERRVNELGVAEPLIARYTERDQILVQLPGVSDVVGAKKVIRSTAQLRLVLVEQGPFASREAALQAYGNRLPTDLDILPGRGEAGVDPPFYVVRRVAAITGHDLRTARASADEYNRPAVAFTLKQDAAQRFGTFTEENVGRPMATVLDDRVTSVATIVSRIDSQGQIVGVSREDMFEQVINLRSGALPADLEYVAEQMIGASLGASSVRSGVMASIAGLLLVVGFMVAYYRRAGLNALASITLNLLLLLGVVAYIPIPMTLPGIAGLILTIGMGVDSNVLIFERIKEELLAGRRARQAVTAAFDRVWITIVDTHVASLIAAAVLFYFGTSSIKGFATTLAIGLVANVFTAVFVSRTLFMLLLRNPGRTDQRLSIQWRLPAFLPERIDFLRWRTLAVATSLVVIAAGAGTLFTKGLPLGIDFSGGTLVVVEFQDAAVTEEMIRSAVSPLPGDELVQQYGAREEHRFQVRLPLTADVSPHDELDVQERRVTQALAAAGLPEFSVVSRELVTAVIGEDMQLRGIYATIASIVAITIFIGLRFRFSFAIGGIAATLHDLLVTLGCLALAGYDLSLNVTAALLTITGYSINDTIVVFDRVREGLKAAPRQTLAAVVNASVNQTLSRTLITAGTTLLSAVALFVYGGEALEGFAFTIIVGIVSGTYSTVFIASAIAVVLSKQKARARIAPDAIAAPPRMSSQPR